MIRLMLTGKGYSAALEEGISASTGNIHVLRIVNAAHPGQLTLGVCKVGADKGRLLVVELQKDDTSSMVKCKINPMTEWYPCSSLLAIKYPFTVTTTESANDSDQIGLTFHDLEPVLLAFKMCVRFFVQRAHIFVTMCAAGRCGDMYEFRCDSQTKQNKSQSSKLPSSNDMEQAFLELRKIPKMRKAAQNEADRLGSLKPGNSDYDAIRSEYVNTTDPDAGTSAELSKIAQQWLNHKDKLAERENKLFETLTKAGYNMMGYYIDKIKSQVRTTKSHYSGCV